MQQKQTETNPLLKEWTGPYGGVQAFDKMNLADLKPAMERGMELQLSEIEKIANNPAPATFENTIEAMERAGVARRIALRVPHFTVVPMVLERTDLILTLPARVARVFERRGKLKALPPPVPIPQAEVAVHWHERFEADPGNRWLRGLMVELYSD